MACRALSVVDRAVVPWVLLEQASHIHDYATISRDLRLVVTREAKVLLQPGHQRGHHAAVSGVAGITGFLCRQRAVNEWRGLDALPEFIMLMAQVAELWRVLAQLSGVLRRVCVMAVETAPVHNRCVRAADQLHARPQVFVAVQTQLLRLLGQELGHP